VIETADSSVFKNQQHEEDREREQDKDTDGLDNSQDDKDDNQNIQNVPKQSDSKDCFESNNMQVATVAAESRVTIKDIINSHKSTVRRKRKVLPVDNSSKASEHHESSEVSEESKPAPKFHKRIIIVDGKPQIDQSSLMVEESHFRRTEDDPKNFKVINDDEYTSSNALIYPKRSHTKKWSEDETEFFYRCLEQCGTDFSMIESKFNGARNRIQIKNKFRKEEGVNPDRVDDAITVKVSSPINYSF
jgi:hypothetical protein